MEALRTKERHDETQFTTKIDDGFVSFTPLELLLFSLFLLFFWLQRRKIMVERADCARKKAWDK